MPVGQFGGFTPPGRAFEEPFLDEERFVDLLDRAGVFADGRGDGIQPDGAPTELFDDGAEYLVVHLVETAGVYVQGLERRPCNGQVYDAVPFHHGEIPYPPEQGVGDTGRSAASQRDLLCRIVVYVYTQDGGRTLHDTGQHIRVVIFEMTLDTETRPQRRSQQSAPGTWPPIRVKRI